MNSAVLGRASSLRRAGAATTTVTRAHLTVIADYVEAVSPTSAEPAVPELEIRFAAGEETALREAYDAFGALVFNLCRRSVGDDHAADVCQEVWVAAWRSRHRYEPARGSLAGWLVGIARFKVLDQLRRARRGELLLVDGDPGPSSPGDPVGLDERVASTAERLLVAEALDALEPRQRAVVELAFYSDATHQEISERTGIPLGTVKSDIRRGLAKMRRYLEGFDAADRS